MQFELQTHIEQVNDICALIDGGGEYLNKVISYLPQINKIISIILDYFEINEQFVNQVLVDIIYGVEHVDEVILRDTLRYGLLEIYNYVNDECLSGESYE